ncbi:Hypothetical protein SMAX5B_016302, partial [Scophthalmus maximus]
AAFKLTPNVYAESLIRCSVKCSASLVSKPCRVCSPVKLHISNSNKCLFLSHHPTPPHICVCDLSPRCSCEDEQVYFYSAYLREQQ